MAFGDLIYNEVLPVGIPFSIGEGFTFLPGQFLVTGFGVGNFKSGYLDATNNLKFTGTLTTPEAFMAIYDNETDDSYWALAPYAGANFDQYLFHFQSDSTPIRSFDITEVFPDSISTVLSLTPDENEVLIGVRNTTDISRLDNTGNFLGVVA